jgi:hypothetical protein
MASDYDACGPVPFEAPHRTKPGLEAPVVSLDPVVGILGGVVQCGRQEVWCLVFSCRIVVRG